MSERTTSTPAERSEAPPRRADEGRPLVNALDVTRARLAADLADQGSPFAWFAATVLVCRGQLLLDPLAFACLLGVPVDHVHRLESGWRPPAHAPRRLAGVCPALDWCAVGVDPDDPADRARRHPSAGLRRRTGREDGPP